MTNMVEKAEIVAAARRVHAALMDHAYSDRCQRVPDMFPPTVATARGWEIFANVLEGLPDPALSPPQSEQGG